MNKRLTFLAFAVVPIAAIAIVAAMGLFQTSSAEGSPPPAETRVIHMTALEYKGSTSVGSEPCPTATPPPGGGYKLDLSGVDCTDPTDRWTTSTYRFEPATLVVNQGDEVELHIWGVNGAIHASVIEDLPGGDVNFVVTRGNLTIVNFTASRAGNFQMICQTHPPSMTMDIVVLPWPDR